MSRKVRVGKKSATGELVSLVLQRNRTCDARQLVTEKKDRNEI